MAATNAPKKGSNKSGQVHSDYATTLGGIPDKKSVEQIEKAHRPSEKGRAPGSVRK